MSTTVLSPVRTKGHLLRILGVGFGIAVSVGDTVGSGILRTPGEVASYLRSSWLIIAVWLVGGAYAFFCTVSVTELGTMLPQTGGWYVYSRRAFGEYGGFVVGCCDWVMQAVAVAYLAVAAGEFAGGLQPRFAGHVKLVAVTSLVFLGFLNWLGLRPGCRTQELTSLAKAVGLIGFVVACFVIGPSDATTGSPVFTNFSAREGSFLLAIVLAFQSVIVSYDGWYGAIYFVEEDQDPSRNLPRSAIGGVLACITIFLLVNIALLHVLPMTQLATSQVPAADAAMAIFGSHGRQIILIISLVTVVSTINATLLISPRILFAMGRDGLLPGWIASVNAGGTPSAALILSTVASIALVLSGSFETLIAIASFLFVAVYISGFAALFVLRAREPHLARPFRVWGYPWTTLGVLLLSVGFLIGSVIGDVRDSLFTLVLVALSYPIYLFAVKKKISRLGTNLRP
jgi:APA family basic amino acid/polyamine antiporter